MTRLATKLVATAVLRLAGAQGGTGAVLARGDPDAGGLIVVLAQRAEIKQVLEQGRDLQGRVEWRDSGGQVSDNPADLDDYLRRRRSRDPDLWVVELNVADTERFAAELRAVG